MVLLLAVGSSQQSDAELITGLRTQDCVLSPKQDICINHTTSRTVLGTLWKRRQKECRSQRMGVVLWNAVFWVGHGLTAAMVVRTRSAQHQTSQNPGIDGLGDLHPCQLEPRHRRADWSPSLPARVLLLNQALLGKRKPFSFEDVVTGRFYIPQWMPTLMHFTL